MILFVPTEGLEFKDIKLGPMLLKEWGGNPEGQWVSVRRATIDDEKALRDAISGR